MSDERSLQCGEAPQSSQANSSKSDCDLTTPKISLADYNNSAFSRGRPAIIEVMWMVLQAILVSSFIPGSAHRAFLLRAFGAQIGSGVTLKPGIRIKFPWRLRLGDNVWLGENVWIDNLETVWIGSDVCISQGVYLCTGNHDWSSTTFDLRTSRTTIEDSAWIAARGVVGPDVIIGEGAVLGLGSTACSNLEPWSIYVGNPARLVKPRTLDNSAQQNSDHFSGSLGR